MNLQPPSEDECSVLVQHILTYLSSDSSFSRRRGPLSEKKAGEHAKEIERFLFAVANYHASINPDADADGISFLNLYAKERSNLLKDALERGTTAETRNLNVREAFPEIVGMKETVFDMSTGFRRILTARLARKLLSPLEEPGNPYTKICFGNKSFGVNAAHVARRVLRGVRKTLKDVELKDFYFERSEAKALKVMSIISSALRQCVLRSLILELVVYAEKGLIAFGPLFKSQTILEELKFTNTRISEKSARALCEFLPSVERIKCLHFSHSYSKDDAIEILSMLVEKCIALEDFKFSKSLVGKRGIRALVRALSQGRQLKTLNLSYNDFGAIGGVALTRHVFPKHLDLTEVYFDHMYLRDEGTIVIANGLKDAAPSLSVLSVRGNYISPKAAPALADCLLIKKLLTVFYAGENMLMDDGSVVICTAILEGNEWLKELDLSKNGMTDIGAQTAVKAVANKPYFSRLFIFENSITAKGNETVRDMLRKGTKGAELCQLNIWEHFIPETWGKFISDSDTESEVEPKKRKVRHGSDSDTGSEVKLKKHKVRHGSDSELEVKLKKQKSSLDNDSDFE